MQNNIAFWLAIFGSIGTIFIIVGFFLQFGKRMKGLANIFKNSKVILIFICCSFVLSSSAIYVSLQSPSKSPIHWSKEQRNLKKISHSPFVNQEVILDGIHYEDCTFENVSFKYNGTAPCSFIYNNIVGKVQFLTNDDIVFTTTAVLKGLGFLKMDIPLFRGPERRELEYVKPPIYKQKPRKD